MNASNFTNFLTDIPHGGVLYWHIYFNGLTNTINYYFLACGRRVSLEYDVQLGYSVLCFVLLSEFVL